MRTAELDLTTGELQLQARSGVTVLRPSMTLQQFAQTPVARQQFPRGFERRHTPYSGYLIGTWEIDQTPFNVALGFSATGANDAPEHCRLNSMSLHPCLAEKKAGVLHRLLSALGLMDTPLDSKPAAVIHCEHWWQKCFGETASQQVERRWGSICLVRNHSYSGPLIEIEFHAKTGQ